MIKSILLFSLSVTIFFSCQTPELTGYKPIIDLQIKNGYIYSDTIINVGKQYLVSIYASSGNGENLTNLIITSNGQRIVDKGFNLPEINEDIILTKTNDETEIISFIIINKVRKRDTISITIKKMNSPYSAISRIKSDFIGAQNNLNKGNYFSFSDGKRYTQSQAFENQQLIDLINYYDSAGDENTIASPGANLSGITIGNDSPENWTIKRTTKYSREALIISDSEFNNANNDSLILAYLFTDGGRKAKQLQKGKYFGFQTNEGKYGILKIESVSGQADGTIQLSLIIQK